MRCRWFRIALLCTASALSLTAVAARAQATSINSLDLGWYDNLGGHETFNKSYSVGEVIDITTQSPTRNFFVFDVPAGVTIPAARVRLFNPASPGPGYDSADPTETFALFDVTTPITMLRGQGGVAAYTDLGTGTVFGSATVSSADNGKFVTVELNPAALAALDAARGGQFAVGGAITTIGGPPRRTQNVFGWTPATAVPGNTVLEIVPEPGAAAVMSVLCAGSLLKRRVRRRPLSARG
jgi:hypothetical protein